MTKHTITILLSLLLFVSCTVTKYVPVEVEKVKTEYISKVDSLIIKDSVFISEKTRNDTVYIKEFKYKYIDKVKRDTVFRTDTIPVIKEVQVDVPYVPDYYKKINRYFWGLISVFVIFIIYKIKKRL